MDAMNETRQDAPAYVERSSGDVHEWSHWARQARWAGWARGAPQHGHDVEHDSSAAAVLVVDDDWAIRESLRLMLEDAGYAVAEARDGEEALNTLRSAPDPRVVLLDLMMPRVSGEEVLGDVLRDARMHARTAFIVITADTGRITPALRQQLGAQGIPILAKPLDIDDVLAHVASAEQRLHP